MTATLPFIQETFERFNALCFEGKLPQVPVVLTKAGTFLGKMEYKVKRNFWGKVTSRYDFRLKISTGFDLSEKEIEDVVIHEMIHYWIALQGIRDTSAHGEKFRSMMNTINKKFGRHVKVSHHTTQEQNLIRGKNNIRKHFVCVSTFPGGDVGITVCASTKIGELKRKLPRYYRISKMEWYESIDPFFNRYPRSRTPKIYKVNREELLEHLNDAVPLGYCS